MTSFLHGFLKVVSVLGSFCRGPRGRAPGVGPWLPGQLPWLVGGVLAVGGIWTSLILARCHFGMVVNGAKLRKVVSGDLGLAGLN